MTITTTTADAARPATIETLQRAWLAEAAKGKAKDIMAHARRTGEKLHDQNLKLLEANLKLLSRPPSRGDNDELQVLRNTYHKDAQHHSEDDPVYAALKPFLTTNGAARQRLEDIAREYMSLEQDYLDMADRRPDRAQHFLALAATERQKADAQLAVSRTDQETNLQPKPKPPRALSNQRLPIRTLEKVVDSFTERTKRTIRLQYPDEPEEEDTAADDEDSPPPEKLRGTNKYSYYTPPEPHDPGEPDLRLDETTLRNICQQATGSNEIPPHMSVLLIGSVGDQAIVDTIAAIDRECAEEHRQRNAQNTCMRAWKAHKTIYTTADHRFPPEAPDNLLDADTLARAWQDAGWEGNMPDYMNTLLAGPKGRNARQEAFAQARTELLQAEEHHEKTVWQMTDRQRIQKRLNPDYRHSPLDLTREQLTAIWRNDGDDGPMPRAWLTQSHELPWRPLLDVLLKREHEALQLHQAAMADYHRAIQEDVSKATLTRKYRETLDTLQHLTAFNQQVDQEFDATGLETPPPPARPDLPEPPEPKNQAKLDIGTTTIAVGPPPRTHPQPKARSKPAKLPSIRLL